MPRKTQTPQSVLANRQSQQRSRARKADLVASLRDQVAAYERAGVAATLEMQRAARAVMEENERLRALLAASSAPPGLRCGNCGWRIGEEGKAELEAAHVLRGLIEAAAARGGACARDERRGECERTGGEGCCPPEEEDDEAAQATPGSVLETSCEAAVDILTELQRSRGEVDAGQVRDSLGCDGAGTCRVSNTRLFDIMDKIS
ncbi:hypothetical protein B0T18DRAFT_427913 [Schizothecium vesticola]|uniref:BZIP domain-containing protein n=1 Tax=Schizothecium vesticola TaxID=314040 RepID=A0AA40F2T5_9PEZI|nr:hypothetical protein B0T18DRAFT_427913 [Schizothecium vesticola]